MAEKNSKVITRQYTIKDSKKNTVTKKKSWLREMPSKNFHA